MSTNDVPGAVPANGDTLAMGCWAEHADGSMIFVESTEAGRVIYCMFDTKNHTQYRDAMPGVSFKSTFSWQPSNPKSVKWTWHDKTPFPWNKVIGGGFPDGQDAPSADHIVSAAARVQASRQRHQQRGAVTGIDPDDYEEGEAVYYDGGNVITRPRTAAQRVADDLALQGEAIRRGDWEDRMERVMNRVAGTFGKLAAALDRLPGKKSSSKGRSAR